MDGSSGTSEGRKMSDQREMIDDVFQQAFEVKLNQRQASYAFYCLMGSLDAALRDRLITADYLRSAVTNAVAKGKRE